MCSLDTLSLSAGTHADPRLSYLDHERTFSSLLTQGCIINLRLGEEGGVRHPVACALGMYFATVTRFSDRGETSMFIALDSNRSTRAEHFGSLQGGGVNS